MTAWNIRVAALVGVLAGLSGAVTAQTGPPDSGYLRDDVFTQAADAVCGLGRDMTQGCAAIRAREIVDASSAPWRAIGRVNFAGMQTRQHCTGTLVAERVVLTAAHCLYNAARKAWIPPGGIVFVAGFQRGEGVAVSRGVRYVLDGREDTNSRDFRSRPDADWALILRCSAMPGDSGAPVLVQTDQGLRVAGVFSSVVSHGTSFTTQAIPANAFRAALTQAAQ